ncbi:MAG: hypothetical protein ABI725_10265 [Chloroflexota bacterium]
MKRSAPTVLLAAALLLVAACSGGVVATPTLAPTPVPTPAPTAQPTATPSATPTTAPTPAPTASPTAAPTATPTIAPTPAPTATPTAAPTATPTPAPTATGEAVFPNAYEDLLVSYVLTEIQDTCKRYPPTYDTELASVECGPEDLTFDYTLFDSAEAMNAAYNGDLDLGDFPSDPDGSCKEANYEDTYTIGGDVAGRVNCRQHTSSSSGSLYHVIEWTSDELLVLGYISNRADLRSWQDLIDFWVNKAGPITP